MKTILTVHGQRLQTAMMRKLKRWPERIEERQWAILLINFESVTVLCIKLFTRNAIQKYSREMGAKINDWKPEKSSGIVQLATGLISKGGWGIFKMYCNRRWKLGSPFWTWNYTAKHALETPFFSKEEEDVPGPTIGGVRFGTHKGLYLNVTGERW
jgi:hypothetical protein